MTVLVFNILLLYAVNIFLVGITFQALSNKYNWNFSPKKSLIILFLVFAIFENLILPLVYSLDATVTIRNEAIASTFEIPVDYPLINLFGFGFFEFFTWLIQAALAGLIGAIIIKPNKYSER